VTDAEAAYDWRCYKHGDREAGVKCRRCERPICPDCMISAPVGFQCRECVKGAPPVRTARSLRQDPWVTWVLLAVNLAIFLPQLGGGSGADAGDLGLAGPLVAAGDWWRIVTSGFVHANLLHVGFNMFLLFQLGTMLEPSLGRVRFAVLYLTALLAGSVGVLLLDPNALTVGASGAVFGLMSAAFVLMKRRGIDPMQSGIGGLLLINVLLSFRPGISLGGHLGGLVGGAVAALILDRLDGSGRERWLGAAACAVLGLAFGGTALWLASNPL
jgi:membrane associated rhomboid family serine protease